MKNYEPLLTLFSAHLENYTKTLASKQPTELYEPENYILSLGGKRLRPLLCLVACDLFDKDPKQALNAALCVELFHNFSLIHDDILDKAPLRRGQATVHSKWDENIAILSGDVMLVKAFDALNGYDADTLKKLMTVFTETSIKVCEGQQMDMNFEKLKDVSAGEYIQMITNKTAVLLGCSLKMGGIVAGASDEQCNDLYEFGKLAGISFQLMDDLLDVYAPEGFGKQKGGDILANKKTFLFVKALERGDRRQKEKLHYLMGLPNERASEKVKGIVTLYNEISIKNATQSEADKYTEQALDRLNKINAGDIKKKDMAEMILNLLQRQH